MTGQLGQLGFIGRTFTAVHDHKTKRTSYQLNKDGALMVDFSKKQHTFIVATSGGGKSYLAGVYAEELVRVMENYSVVMIDPMGIFSTLTFPNTNQAELDAWNTQIPGDVKPARVNACTTWVPFGDIGKFSTGAINVHGFALRAPEFSYGTLCYAFDLDFLEPQVNLYRKSQKLLREVHPNYALTELIAYIRTEGSGLGFQSQTVEALVTKLGALEELGIVAADAPTMHEMVGAGKVVIFDLSQSSEYAARILINFLAENLLFLRRRISWMIMQAKVSEMQIEKPPWYVPPVQLVIDEAHNYLPRNPVLKKCIKEGRNNGLMVSAISQSPDLTRDVYENITHLFVGSMIYEGDIAAVRAMLPVDRTIKEFRKDVHSLEPGAFLYYNTKTKQECKICVRPRRSLHPAMTDLGDERKYFKGYGIELGPLPAKAQTIILDRDYSELRELAFSVIERKDDLDFKIGTDVQITAPAGTGVAKVIDKQVKSISSLPDEFLVKNLDARDRNDALFRLNARFETRLSTSDPLTILRLVWVRPLVMPRA